MARTNKFPYRTLIALTTIPSALVGGGLLYLSSLLPSCTITEHQRLRSPDAVFDLVIFSRDCDTTTGPNTQAALIPADDHLPDDAASFASVGVVAEFDPRWDGFGHIELTLPEDAEIYRQDAEVAGIGVIYR